MKMKETLYNFRFVTKRKERVNRCPFREIRIDFKDHYSFHFYRCDYCNDIFGLMPPRIPFGAMNKQSFINTLNPCPCQRFGIEHVRKILKKKGL